MGFGVTRAATAGKVVQMVNTQTGAVATGTTVMPLDDTIPQITEGDQYMTLNITPNNASNILFIQVVAFASSSVLARLSVALFVGSTANALAVVSLTTRSGGEPVGQALNHRMVAGGTSALTFRVRIGPGAAATTTFNGEASTRLFGGVAASSITITEYTP